jgi:LPXTG-motif cell wall-anchored protein
MILHQLPAGVYTMQIMKPPFGYVTGNEQYSFIVTTGQTVDVLAVLQKITLPKTGEMFPWMNYGIAALCLLLAAASGFGIVKTRKRS